MEEEKARLWILEMRIARVKRPLPPDLTALPAPEFGDLLRTVQEDFTAAVKYEADLWHLPDALRRKVRRAVRECYWEPLQLLDDEYERRNGRAFETAWYKVQRVLFPEGSARP